MSFYAWGVLGGRWLAQKEQFVASLEQCGREGKAAHKKGWKLTKKGWTKTHEAGFFQVSCPRFPAYLVYWSSLHSLLI